MDVSFAPDGLWFVFCTDTGKTLKKRLASKADAVAWMLRVAKAQAEAEKAEATVH